MLARISQSIAKNIITEDIDLPTARACAYGVEIALHTVLSTLGLLLIGALFHQFIGSVIIITVYYINQTLGGGYHATSHLRCFIMMAIGLVFCMLLLRCFPAGIISQALSLGASIYLFLHPVHLHSNKKYLMSKMTSLKMKSRIAIIAIWTVTACLHLFPVSPQLLTSACIGIFVSSVSRAAGLFTAKRRKQ